MAVSVYSFYLNTFYFSAIFNNDYTSFDDASEEELLRGFIDSYGPGAVWEVQRNDYGDIDSHFGTCSLSGLGADVAHVTVTVYDD